MSAATCGSTRENLGYRSLIRAALAMSFRLGGKGAHMTVVEVISAISAAVAILTLVVGVGAFFKAIVEYKRQNAIKRFEIFQAMNRRFDDDQFVRLREFLDDDSKELSQTSYTLKHNFLGFFEELAISVNSKVMSENVAFYMFGYYAIRCWESKEFWKGDKLIQKESIYWALFRSFALRMKNLENRLGSGGIASGTMKF
jgi:hypothetical protein